MKPTTDTTLALALALDGTAAPATDEIKRLSGIAGMVDALPDPEIDARFVARLEATLMAEFDAKFGPHDSAAPLRIVKPVATPEPASQPKAVPNVVAFPQRRLVVRRAIAGMIAAAMLSAMPVVAAASSLPGSPFFGIERWRQNHAISSAHGADKAFASERVARTWIGYAAQMTVLGYDLSDIEAVLFRAGELQTQAAGLIARYGSDREIATMAGLFAEDATRLREILPRTSESLRPAINDAIATATELTRTLVGNLRRIGANVRLPDAVAAVAPVTDGSSEPAGTSPSRNGTSKDPSEPGEPTDDVTDETRREYARTASRTCDLIAREEAGDLLAAPSKVVCTVRDLDPSELPGS